MRVVFSNAIDLHLLVHVRVHGVDGTHVDHAAADAGVPSGARWGSRPMACTMGSRGGAPVRSQAARCASIAQSAACLGVPTSAGPRSGDRSAIASACQQAACRQRQLLAGS